MVCVDEDVPTSRGDHRVDIHAACRCHVFVARYRRVCVEGDRTAAGNRHTALRGQHSHVAVLGEQADAAAATRVRLRQIIDIDGTARGDFIDVDVARRALVGRIERRDPSFNIRRRNSRTNPRGGIQSCQIPDDVGRFSRQIIRDRSGSVRQSEVVIVGADRIAANGDDPAEYVEISYRVSEAKFSAWPESLKSAFAPARTLKTGKAGFRLALLQE